MKMTPTPIETVARIFNVRLENAREKTEEYTNRSTGGYVIVLGFYDNPENRTISFFHELGHSLQLPREPFDLYYDLELKAWERGLAVGWEHGHQFSRRALLWADEQLRTYLGYEEREVLNYVSNPHRMVHVCPVFHFATKLYSGSLKKSP